MTDGTWRRMYLRDTPREILKNVAMSMPWFRRRRLSTARTAPTIDLNRYVFEPAKVVLRCAGPVAGKHVVEIGPGDHLATGLALLALGAASYTAVDRFAGDYSSPRAKEWYRLVQHQWCQAWPEALVPASFPEEYLDRVKIVRQSAERAVIDGPADVIFSYNVVEHLRDIREFAVMNNRLVNAGATAVHRIDFGPHDVWRSYDDPLTFLRAPDWLWNLMGSARGTPNRKRLDQVLNAFQAPDIDVTTHIDQRLVGPVPVEKLSKQFRSTPIDILCVLSATVISRRKTSIPPS